MKYQQEVSRGTPGSARLFGSSYGNWPAVAAAYPKNNHTYHDTSLYDDGIVTRNDLIHRARGKSRDKFRSSRNGDVSENAS